MPGPTIRVNQGRKVVVRHINKLPAVHPTLGYTPWTSVHLHGSASLPQYDGYASDITYPGQYKDYHYPNFQDGAHALVPRPRRAPHGRERLPRAGRAVPDASTPSRQSLPIPQGEYDVPADRRRRACSTTTGQLLFTHDDDSGLCGDVILVNGRPWPVMQVERRKYRFRILNASVVAVVEVLARLR